MPIWEWQCEKCNHIFEELLTEKPLYVICPKCKCRAKSVFPTKMSFKLIGNCWESDGYSYKGKKN